MRHPYIAGFVGGRNLQPLFVVALGILILCACTPPPLPASKNVSLPVAEPASATGQPDHPVGFLRGFHHHLVDASGCEVHLRGVNWFGLETGTFAPHGLLVRNWQDNSPISRSGSVREEV